MMARSLIGLAKRHPQRQFHWTHFGDGPAMRELRAVLATTPSNLGVQLPGQVENALIAHHYASQAVDVFLLLSSTEGLPLAIQEALSAGLPIIATDVGGVGEAVGADNGILLSANPSVDEVIAAIERVALDCPASDLLAMREQSRRRWERDFSAESNHTAFALRLRILLNSL
jgi:glycosyltransferase involved in cell wall biosynthesis